MITPEPTASSDTDRLARWKQIQDDLVRRINAGEFSDEFPGELRLAQEYDASRGTIRHALRHLRERGLVDASPGRSPRVVNEDRASSFGPIYSLHEVIKHDGMTQSNRVVVQEVAQSIEVAHHAELPEDTDLFHLRRVRLANGSPIALDDVWIPLELAAPMASRDFTHTPIYRELKETCGVVLDGGREEVCAVAANAEQAQLLECDLGAPLLCLRRRTTYRGSVAEFRYTYALGDRFSFVRTFGRSV